MIGLPKVFHSKNSPRGKRKDYMIFFAFKQEYQNKLYRGSGTNPLPILAHGEKQKDEIITKLKADQRLENIGASEI